MEGKWSRLRFYLKAFWFLSSDNLALRELRTEKIFQVFRASLAMCTYALKNGQIREWFFHMIRNRDYPAALANGTRFLQLFLDNNSRRNAQMPNGMRVPTTFKTQLYFHVLVCLSRRV